MKRPDSVDEYIASAPKEIQFKLKELRGAIKSIAPKAQEKISYGMPYYDYFGRLVYFRYAKSHIGLYIPGSVLTEHGKELKGYSTSRATVRFPLDKQLPIGLIKKLIKARAKENEKNK